VRFLVLVLSPPRRTEYEYDEIRCEAQARELAEANQGSMAIKTP
jgi:hypothetical protein